MLGYDDRVEEPKGVTPHPALADHRILEDCSRTGRTFSGYNRVIPVQGDVVLSFDEDPLLVVGPTRLGARGGIHICLLAAQMVNRD
jgi:uncharacterized membrane protein